MGYSDTNSVERGNPPARPGVALTFIAARIMLSPMIRDATEHDAPAIAAVYNPYITELLTSFEKDPLSDSAMADRVRGIQAGYPWLVYDADGEILGYAYAARWKERHAYRYCAETCIYLRRGCEGRGIGTALYAELLRRMPDHGLQVAIACIALPNAASVALHEKFGYVKAGHFPRVGFKFGQWIDIGYWQKRLSED